MNDPGISRRLSVLIPALVVLIILVVAGAGALTTDADPVPAPSPTTATATATASAPDAPTIRAIDGPMRGMTISCQTWGGEWGTDEMVESMRLLKSMGVTWIAIHPYAGIRTDGTVRMRGKHYQDETDWLTRPIREAHALGLKVLMKPHIAYWGTPFSWRAEIAFQTDEQWARFFQTYEAWITRVAELTNQADAFTVGTELGGTVHHDAQWRQVIAAIRRKTDAPLTYSGNWDRYEQVPFWDALDLIGIQAYFPLVDHDRLPESNELDLAWTTVLRRLEKVSQRHNRPILLAELGYNRSSVTAQRPWEYRQGGPNAELVQQRCLDAALKAIGASDFIAGSFLWKWFPGEEQGSNFIMSTPAMRETIKANWGK